MTNVLLTDLGLSVPPESFFASFIDKCVSTSVDLAIYWQYTLNVPSSTLIWATSIVKIQGIKSFGNVKQAAC